MSVSFSELQCEHLLHTSANCLPRRIVLLGLPDGLVGILRRPADRLESPARNGFSPDGTRRRHAAGKGQNRHQQQRGAHRVPWR